MLMIDGSQGEGGGQIVRTSLALAALTQTPLVLQKIRAGRRKPGLLRQHLTALRAVTAITGAEVEGATLGSRSVRFTPKKLTAGDYGFAIGSAGSANLVLQTLLPPLLAANGASTVVLEGGTHNPFSPPFHFLQKSFLPLLNRMGPTVALHLDRWGFNPAGGGQLTAQITPGPLRPIELVEPDPIELSATAVVAHIPGTVAKRELTVLGKMLRIPKERLTVQTVESRGPGNVVWVEARSSIFTACFTAFGAKGQAAERVAKRLANQVSTWQATGAPIDDHLADQLLIPMAMAGGGAFRCGSPTLHTLTNMAVIERFLPVAFSTREGETSWTIEVRARGG